MSRALWFGTGLAAGAVVVRRGTRRRARGAGLHRRPPSMAQRARDFTAAVREGMAEREAELLTALGVGQDVDRNLDRTGAHSTLDHRAARELLEHPTSPRH